MSICLNLCVCEFMHMWINFNVISYKYSLRIQASSTRIVARPKELLFNLWASKPWNNWNIQYQVLAENIPRWIHRLWTPRSPHLFPAARAKLYGRPTMDSDLCLYDPSSGNGAACAKCFASAASTKMASETKCWYCHVVHLLCFGELLWKAPPWSKATAPSAW